MTRKTGLVLGVVFAAVAIAIVFAFSTSGERYDMPEPLEVEYLDRMKDVSTAETEFSTLPSGQRQLTIRHEVIEGVTPEMIVWWFQNFPTRTVRVAGEDVPWYRLWHPRDHIVVVIRERGDPDVPGISEGAQIVIHERRARVLSCSGAHRQHTDGSLMAQALAQVTMHRLYGRIGTRWN